jgi:hypothetical protein
LQGKNRKYYFIVNHRSKKSNHQSKKGVVNSVDPPKLTGELRKELYDSLFRASADVKPLPEGRLNHYAE